ncbi:MAG: ABC transporter substrate-binding protein [Dongiaceae bacterium]
MKKLLFALLAVGVALAARPAWSADKVTFALNWNVPYSGWAGFYVAQDKGYFAAEGLDVEFLLVKGSNPANQAIAAGNAQLGVSTASSVMVAASQGLPLVAVSAYMQSNPEGVIARKDRGIENITDFAGKKVGYNVSNPTVYLFEAKLKRAGVNKDDITWVTVQPEAMVPLLLSGEIDAAMGYWDWEAINVEQQGLGTNVFVMSDDKVQIYGGIVSANADWAKDHGDVIRRFLRASVKGWIDAAADLDATLAVMMKANPEEDEAFMRQALAISTKLIGSSDADTHGFGWMDKADWQGLQEALLQGKVIEKEVDLDTLFTNDYMPDNATDWKSQ